ncbi:MAG TPA: hypothetical protein VEC99_15615 [Clostridia bacterium]|nr:hypothetical protein [Clostridia bacterium]
MEFSKKGLGLKHLVATWMGIWAASWIACAASVADSSQSQSKPLGDNTLTVPLEYHEVSFGVSGVGLSVKVQQDPFKKEPQLSSTGIHRGRLPFPGQKENDLPFIWDTSSDKLYLDFNRNEDLTDDPDAVFSSASRSEGNSSFQHGMFSGVKLTLPSDAGQCPWLVDLNFTAFRNYLNVYAEVRSFWAAKATLGGREWQVGLVFGVQGRSVTARNSYLLLRPWEDQAKGFNTGDGSLAAFAFPQKVFIPTSVYQVQRTDLREGDKLRLQLRFKAEPTELGDLTISGEFTRRLLLTGGSCVAVLDTPKGTLKVPVGTYSGHQVQVGTAEATTHLEAVGQRSVVVTKNEPSTFAVGGPLTNGVTFSRRGNNLVLQYQLLGAGGETYAPMRDHQNPPQFAVYQGDKKIGSGKFEFG